MRLGTLVRLVFAFAAGVAFAPTASAADSAERVPEHQLAQGQWVRQKSPWRPLSANDSYKTRTLGTLKLSTRGRAIVVETLVPTVKDGKKGIVRERLYGTRLGTKAPPADADRIDNAERAFGETVKSLARTHLNPVPLEAIYTRALEEIAKQKPADRLSLWGHAMNGAASGIDSWTRHLDPEAWKAYRVPADQRQGIGVVLSKRPSKQKGIRLNHVFPGSSAHRAGLRKGDLVVGIDGNAVADHAETVRLLAGPLGKRLRLDVARNGVQRMVEVTRSEYKVQLLHSKLMKNGVGVVRLDQFYEGSADAVLGDIAALETKHGAPLGGLVFDVRGNPGGPVRDTVKILQSLVAKGPLARFKNRSAASKVYKTNASKLLYPDLPLTILVDENSGSASELLAGVLKNGRAKIIGSRTFGKGVQQIAFELADGSALKMTNMQFFTPDVSPHGVGVEPDVTKAQAIAGARALAQGRSVVDPVLQYAIDEVAVRSAGR